MNYIIEKWEKSNEILKKENNYRKIFSYSTKIDPDNKIDFSSNDYLGLRKNPTISLAGYENALKSGNGNGSSRIIKECDEKISYLEKFFCLHTNFKRALFFSSGFLANLTFFDVLSPFFFESIDQEVFIDHRAHASLFFSLKNSGIKKIIFQHHNYSHLEKKIQNSTAKVKIIVVESLYSMDGDLSCPKELYEICKKYNAMLFVDETHSFGIYGEKGQGWLSLYPFLKKYVIAAVFGCGKAVGICGGFLATNNLVFYERIIQKSKVLIYSTAVTPSLTGSVLQSLKIIFNEEGSEKRKKLLHNISFFNTNFKNENNSHIIPIIVHENHIALKLTQYLFKKNIIAKAIRPPSVPNRTARIRIILTSEHTEIEIEKLCNNIKYFLKMEQIYL